MRHGAGFAIRGLTGIVVLLLLAAGLPAAAGEAAVSSANGIAYRVVGSGKPVIVMITGLGDDMSSFQAVAADLSRDATVVLFDRPGHGGSKSVPGVRDAKAIDRELSDMLTQAHVKGPYILVGHSLGGQFAEYYAASHPDQVAGLILEESRPTGFTRFCQDSGVKMCVPPAMLMNFMPAGAKAENADAAATEAEIDALPPLSGKPVLVLSRKVGAKASRFDVVWGQGQEKLAARYPGAVHRIADTEDHYLHKAQAAWFVTTVRAFAADASR